MHVRQTETPLPAPAQAGISWKARQAMKRSSPSHVHAIEVPILAFLQQVGEAGLPGMDGVQCAAPAVPICGLEAAVSVATS